MLSRQYEIIQLKSLEWWINLRVKKHLPVQYQYTVMKLYIENKYSRYRNVGTWYLTVLLLANFWHIINMKKILIQNRAGLMSRTRYRYQVLYLCVLPCVGQCYWFGIQPFLTTRSAESGIQNIFTGSPIQIRIQIFVVVVIQLMLTTII
jgi:hypothetical protein